MSTKPSRRAKPTHPEARDDPVSDADVDRFLAEHHDKIDTKLQKARRSIARGEAKPLEPLSTLLRDARRHAKVER